MKHKSLALLAIWGILLFATSCNNPATTNTGDPYVSTPNVPTPNMIKIDTFADNYSYIIDKDTGVVYIQIRCWRLYRAYTKTSS